MNCEIITIGDELLIGQVIDTNSAWMARKLNETGISVTRIATSQDQIDKIIVAINDARKTAKIILMTGGLGPTRDDLTKDALCKYFDSGLKEDPKIVHSLSEYFKSKGRELTVTNRKQAEVPVKCTPVYNDHGTAPGMWFEDGGQIFVSMPGVPYEMMAMMDDYVIPELAKRFSLPRVYHSTLLTVGVGESYLSDLIRNWETSLPDYIKLAYLPSLGSVRLRLSCYDSDPDREKRINEESEVLAGLVNQYLFVKGDIAPEVVIGKMLSERNQTLAVAESCTGGFISHQVTSVPGCSQYYIGSSVSYDNEVKSRFLGVDPLVIKEKGAVSEEVAVAMAIGIREKLGTTWGVSTTGVAGPAGGTPEKPVGTVWIGIAGPDTAYAKLFRFGTNRLRNIQNASLFAFNELRKSIEGFRD